MSQIVDTESAKEFLKEVSASVSPDELKAICENLEIKSRFFQQRLGAAAIEKLSGQEIHQILRAVFATRRKAASILKQFPAQSLQTWMADLLHGEQTPEQRFQQFFDRLEGLDDNSRFDLAGELLHYTFPERYWLWNRWMWDPRVKTGALPLVTTEDVDLSAPTFGGMYLNVGKALAFVHEVGDAAGFQRIDRSLFGTTVFLCSVYAVYSYTVLRMRMTQEFNKVVPALPELTRRLLGVHRMEEYV